MWAQFVTALRYLLKLYIDGYFALEKREAGDSRKSILSLYYVLTIFEKQAKYQRYNACDTLLVLVCHLFTFSLFFRVIIAWERSETRIDKERKIELFCCVKQYFSHICHIFLILFSVCLYLFASFLIEAIGFSDEKCFCFLFGWCGRKWIIWSVSTQHLNTDTLTWDHRPNKN